MNAKEGEMAKYLFLVSYNEKGWAAMVKTPQDRGAAVKPAIEKLGGKLDVFYYAFGKHDVVAIADFPNNAAAAGFAIAAAAGGEVKSLTTTPLMTAADAVSAMKKAGGSSYKPPSASKKAPAKKK
jgi:uncharacterized protein with GYD domain